MQKELDSKRACQWTYLGVDGPAVPPPPTAPEASTFVMMASGIATMVVGMKMRKRRRNTI